MATSNSVRSASSTEGGGSLACRVGTSFLKRRILQRRRAGVRLKDAEELQRTAPGLKQRCQVYFLAMLSIFCFFFRRGREDEDVPTREEVDCETFWETDVLK